MKAEIGLYAAILRLPQWTDKNWFTFRQISGLCHFRESQLRSGWPWTGVATEGRLQSALLGFGLAERKLAAGGRDRVTEVVGKMRDGIGARLANGIERAGE